MPHPYSDACGPCISVVYLFGDPKPWVLVKEVIVSLWLLYYGNLT